MAATLFDTHELVKKLTAAGFSVEQAEIFTEAQKSTFSQAMDSTLATKSDISRLERRMDGLEGQIKEFKAEMNGKLTLVQWMLALIVAAEAMPLVVKLFR
jgi:tryptophanyl-tRNA synthetase